MRHKNSATRNLLRKSALIAIALFASACSPKSTVQLAFNIPAPRVSTSGAVVAADSKGSWLEKLGLTSAKATTVSISPFAPYSATRFDCFFVNIMGDGIGAWADNKSIVAASLDGSGYYGAVSSMLSSSTGGSTSVEVPTGTGRIVEVLGVRIGPTLTTCPATFTEVDINNSTLYPGIFEVGRVTQDTLSDSALVVKNTYDPTTAKDFRYSMRDKLASIDITPPTSGGNLAATTTSSTATLTWTAATDNGTSPENLQYKVVQASAAAALASVDAAEAATVVTDWTEALTTQTASGLTDGTGYAFAVLVKDAGGNKTLYTAVSATTPDVTLPIAGTAISFSNITLTTATVSWGVASDNVTTAANLKYKLVGSATNNLTTVADAEANGTLVMDYTANTLTNALTGLASTSAYYYAVIVKDEAGNKSLYSPASVKPSDNLTYTVTYDGNTAGSGSVPTNTNQYSYSNTLTIATNSGSLAKTGYTFAGWNTAPNGSGTSYAASSTLTMGLANVTLYAQWTINSYALSYDGNGNTGGTAPTGATQTYNTTITVATVGALTKTGYTFAGWKTAPSSGTSYAAGSTFTYPAAAIILYAQWTINSYALSYDGNGNDGGTAPTGATQNYNTTITVASVGTLTKTGYTFAGWKTAPSSGTSYAASSTFTYPASATTLYAQWTINSYALSYDGNGNDGGTAPTGATQNYNTTITVASVGTLTKTGYTFAGWKTAPSSGSDYAASSTFTFTATTTLYAQWTANASSGASVYLPIFSGSTLKSIGSINDTATSLASGSGHTFTQPMSVAVDSSGRIYFTDYTGASVKRMDDMTGTNFTTIGSSGSGTNQFNSPWGIAIGKSGNIYIGDYNNHRVVKMSDMNGSGWASYGTSGSGTGQFSGPLGIALDSSERIYIADYSNNRIVRIDDISGTNWTTFGTSGSGTNQFGQVYGVFVDKSDGDKIYVADSGNNRVVRINDMSGTGWLALGLSFVPRSLCISSTDNRLYITSPGTTVVTDISGTNYVARTTAEGGHGIGCAANLNPPVVANLTLTSSNLTATSFTLSWTQATDDLTPQGNLTYKVYRSAANPSSGTFSTLAQIEAGTLVATATGSGTTSISGYMSSGNAYYFNIVVKDADGNKSIYSPLGEYFHSEQVGYWQFSGDYTDSVSTSVTNHIGAMGSAGSFAPTATTDRFGRANSAYTYSINSSNCLQTLSAVPVKGAEDRTISAWINTTAYNGVDVPFNIGRGGLNYNFGIYRYLSVWQTWLFGNGDINTNTSVTDNTWKHIVLSYGTAAAGGSASLRMYIDGTRIVNSTDRTVNTGGGSNTQFTVGCGFADGVLEWFFTGAIDDVRFFSNQLQDSEVQNLYNATRSSTPTGYVLVPGNASYNTPTAGASFYVMKYEAKSVGGVATSQASGTPWVNLTQPAAEAACGAAGGHLITNQEWEVIARNIAANATNWNTGSQALSDRVVGTGALSIGSSQGSILAASTDDDPNSGVTNNWTYRRTHVLSNGEIIWDLSANAWEFTSSSDFQTYTGSETNWDSIASNSTDRTWYGPPDATWGLSQGMGHVYGRGAGATVNMRGCAADCGGLAGIFTEYQYSTSASTYGTAGFRCVKSIQ